MRMAGHRLLFLTEARPGPLSRELILLICQLASRRQLPTVSATTAIATFDRSAPRRTRRAASTVRMSAVAVLHAKESSSFLEVAMKSFMVGLTTATAVVLLTCVASAQTPVPIG